MSKKLLKIFGYICIASCLLLLLAELSLRFILPLQSVKTKTLQYVSQTTGADVKAGDISASLFGFTLNDISVNVAEQELFNCKKLHISLSPFKLLIGQLYIKKIILQDPFVKITRSQDGAFNFDPLLAGADEQKENPPAELTVPFDIRVHNLAINNAQVSFVDLKENIKANLQNLEFNLNRFSFYKPFDYNLSFKPYFEQNDLIIDGVDFALNAETNLNKLNLADAVLNIKEILLNYKDTAFTAQAEINNFENPSGNISVKLKDLSKKTLSAFIETVQFDIPLITADASFDYFIKESKANIKNLTVKAGDTELNFKANMDINSNKISDGKIKFKSVLESIKNVSPIIEDYKPTGQINADFDFAWPLALAGNLTLADVGLFTDKAGTFEKINTTVNVKSIDDITVDSFSGILNNNPFNMQAKYLKQKEFADVFFDFQADKLYVFNTTINRQTEEPQKQHEKNIIERDEKALKTAAEDNFHPINLDAKIDIKKLDVPFIRGNNLIFKAKAKGITPKMNQTHGIFDLSVNNGQIKDVYTISNANTITKVMFMSLGIVSKVINTLNVLDLLNGMGKMLSGNKEDEEELPVHQEINGKMDFDSFNTKVGFNQGLATMKKCSFVSNLFSFRVHGDINFNSRKIGLNVESAPGKHQDNGIMPLNIDIKGTIENPTGSLSVLSSVGELVTNTITKNPVSNMLKNTWGSLFNSGAEEAENSDLKQADKKQ